MKLKKKVYYFYFLIFYVYIQIQLEKKLLITNKLRYQDYLIFIRNKMNSSIL